MRQNAREKMQNSSSNMSLQRKRLSRQSFSSNGDPSPSARSLLAENDSGQASLPGRPVEQETHDILVKQQSSTYFKYEPVSTGENAAAEVKGPRRRVGVASLPTDCAAVLLSKAMIIFVCLVWKLDGSRVINDSYDSWKNAITVVSAHSMNEYYKAGAKVCLVQLGTFFPILFASIVGRLMTEAIRWNLEKGSTIGCLEQLMGSQTVGGSVLTILRLRSLSVLSPLLLMLWSFSPLGAQSLLRMTELRYSYREIETTSTFFDTNAKSQLTDWSRFIPGVTKYQTAKTRLGVLKSLYTTTITAPEKIKNDTVDIWGNVKIPIFKNMKEQEWQDTSSQNATVQYTSLVGVPVNHVGEGNTSFHIESTYVQLECINATYYLSEKGSDPAARVPIEASGLRRASRFEQSDKPYSLPNGTWHGSKHIIGRTWSIALDRFVDPLWLGDNGTQNSTNYQGFLSGREDKLDRPILFLDEVGVDAGPTSLLFTAKCQSNATSDGSFQSYCGVKQRYIESIIRCSGVTSKKECAVIRQRLSQKPYPSENISQLSFPGVFWAITQYMPDQKEVTYQSESSLYYMKDPSIQSQLDKEVHFLQNVTKEDVSVRLTQLINTYLQLSQLYLNITTAGEIDGRFEPNITVPTTNKEEVLIIHVSKGWAILSLISSLVLLAASIIGAAFKHMARGPEALGYVSTALRDSRHVELDSDSGWMDSIDLSRRMRNERIRLGVVAVGSDKVPVLGIGREKDTDKM